MLNNEIARDGQGRWYVVYPWPSKWLSYLNDKRGGVVRDRGEYASWFQKRCGVEV